MISWAGLLLLISHYAQVAARAGFDRQLDRDVVRHAELLIMLLTGNQYFP